MSGTFKAVLLPIDLASEPSWKRPLNLALELAAGGAMLHVMTVVPDFGMSIVGSYFDESFEKNALDDVTKQLQAWAADHVPGGVDHRIHIAHGTIYAEIMRAADKLECDAIVMAAHRPELKDYLLGPNAARVMRHAGQSVLVVRD